ncbi:MAG: hypothetical protein LC721_08030 [Actinobacteria bacterium]|nr:hypothetical protein [Actinomycetota bacterium]
MEVERYVRWMQEIRRFKPSTVSRRMAVVTGFYRTCVIDAVLEHSPAEYVRRPVVANESPTLGLSHLQFDALPTAARDSENRFDFALVAMLGLLGLRIFEAAASMSTTLVKSTGTASCALLDAGVDLRDVQIAARHADPRTTMRYDRARKNLDRHPTTSSLPT